MKTVIRDGPTAIAASVDGTMAPTVRPIADAAKDSTVTIPQNFSNLQFTGFKSQQILALKMLSLLTFC